MKRIILFFAAAGLFIPIILSIAVRIELYFDPEGIPRSLLFGRYLWPSSFFLLVTNLPGDSSWIGDFAVWTLSILVNVLVYTLVGVIVGSAWIFMLHRHATDH